MGAWGPGPFENDTAMDWVQELRKSNDPGSPLGVLRELDGVGPLATGAAERGIAAAEAVAASRGQPAEEVQADLLEWLRTSGARADAAVAELALRAQERTVSLPSRRAAVRYRTGDVAQLHTSTGKVAYIQLVGRTSAPAFDLIRVMPGLFSPPLSEGSLAVLIGGETAFLSQSSFRSMAALEGFVARGNFLVPGPCAGPQPLKHRPSESSESGVGPVSFKGGRLSADEFARMHPDIDQTMLADASDIPFPENLLRQIECEWRPWMGTDDDWMYPEETGQPPQRPDPYPTTAQPGKFLLSV